MNRAQDEALIRHVDESQFEHTEASGADAGQPRLPVVLGVLGCLAAVIGYGLEWLRQRGACELGDPAPDTLALSIGLILLGGGILGLSGICVSLISAARHSHRPLRIGLAVSIASFLLGASIFLFVGTGPGDPFQYCGT